MTDPASDAPRPQYGVIFLVLFLDLVGFSIIFPLFPSILEFYWENEGEGSLFRELIAAIQRFSGAEEASDWRVMTLFGGALGSLYSLLQFIASPIWGTISDRVGRRPVLLLTVAGLAGSYALWAFASSFTLLVVSRLVGGFMSGNLATATAAMADSTSRADRAKGMGIVGAAFGLGFILGPAVGGACSYVDLSGGDPTSLWNPFSLSALAACALSIVNLLWIARGFRETLPPEARGKGAGRVNPLALLGARFGAAIQRTNLAYFTFLAAFSGMEFTLTFLVTDRLGWSRAQITGMFVYVGLVLVVVQGGFVRRVAPRYGEKRVAIAGLALVIPGLAILAWASSSAVLYVGLTLMGLGSALAIPTLTTLVSLFAPEEEQGRVIGGFRSLGALARVVGPIAAATAYWRFGNAAPYACGAAVMILPILIMTGVQQPDKGPGSGPETSGPGEAEKDHSGAAE